MMYVEPHTLYLLHHAVAYGSFVAGEKALHVYVMRDVKLHFTPCNLLREQHFYITGSFPLSLTLRQKFLFARRDVDLDVRCTCVARALCN